MPDNQGYSIVPFLTPGEELHRGVFYSFHDLPSEPGRWIKKSTPYRKKRYPFGVTIKYPMRLYTLLKYGIPDLMYYEYVQIQKMPEALAEYLLQNVGLGRIDQGSNVLVSDKVLNFDGQLAKSMGQLGRIDNAYFWNEIKKIITILEDTKTYLFGLFSGAQDILVQKLSEEKWKPIVIDVVRVGRRMYPYHPELFIKSYLQKKFTRRKERFLSHHGVL